jgi:hypothetical protein
MSRAAQQPLTCEQDCLSCTYLVAYEPLLKPEQLPGFSVEPIVGHVVVDKGVSTGKISLVVKLARQGPRPDTIALAVRSGHLTGAAFGTVKGAPTLKVNSAENAAEIGQPGEAMAVTLDLDQLVVGDKVTVAAAGKRDNVVVGTPAPVLIDVKGAEK